MHGQHENSIPTTNKVCGGYKNSNINIIGTFEHTRDILKNFDVIKSVSIKSFNCI